MIVLRVKSADVKSYLYPKSRHRTRGGSLGGGLIDLILLDLNMPGMGGEKCLVEVLQLSCAPRILVASGHPPDDSLRERLRAAAGDYVAKPFTVSPHFSRVAYVHLQGIQGRSCTLVPQASDNAANGRMRLAQRVNIF